MLNFSEMAKLAEEINRVLLDAKCIQIREVEEKKWVLSFEHQQKKELLLICASVPFSRFHLLKSCSQAHETSFTKSLESTLIQALFIKACLINNDRILSLEFQKGQSRFFLIFELCFRHPKIVLVAPSYEIIASWEPIAEKIYQPPPLFKKQEVIAVSVSSEDVEKRYVELEEKARWEEQLKKTKLQLESRLKKAQGRRLAHLEGKEKSALWSVVAHKGELLQSYFHLLKKGMSSVEVEDWEKAGEKITIELDPLLTPQEMIKAIFKQAHKLRRQADVIDSLIARTDQEIAKIEQQIAELSKVLTFSQLKDFVKKAGLEVFQSKERAKKEGKPTFCKEFITLSGLHIYVGRSDRENDHLSLSFARGSDLWFHAANTAGSHVVLRAPKDKAVDEESVQDALQLALYFSKAKGRAEDEVTMTQCKYLSKPKSAKPGQVNVSKHKNIRVRPDPKRLNRLLNKPLDL